MFDVIFLYNSFVITHKNNKNRYFQNYLVAGNITLYMQQFSEGSTYDMIVPINFGGS